MLADFLSDLGAFISYFLAGGLSTLVYMLVYSKITPYPELELIKSRNQAAAIAFGGSLLGFMLAITALIRSAVNMMDFAMWSIVAIIIQVATYFVVQLAFPKIAKRIEDGEVPSAIWLAAASIAAGMLNAASLTY